VFTFKFVSFLPKDEAYRGDSYLWSRLYFYDVDDNVSKELLSDYNYSLLTLALLYIFFKLISKFSWESLILGDLGIDRLFFNTLGDFKAILGSLQLELGVSLPEFIFRDLIGKA